MFYAKTSIILQKRTVLTHFAWERPQICTFWHEKAGVLCRNINHYRPWYIWRPPKNVHQIKWRTKGRLNNVHQIKCQTEGRRKNKITTNFGWSSKKRPPKCKLPTFSVFLMLVLLLKPLRLLSFQDTCELVVVCWCWGAATFGYITAIFHWLTLDITHFMRRNSEEQKNAAAAMLTLPLC